MTINKVTQQSKKYRSKKGGVTFEFFLVTAILVIFLNYLFDIAQRVGQFSWL